jgi:hypothetical protein
VSAQQRVELRQVVERHRHQQVVFEVVIDAVGCDQQPLPPTGFDGARVLHLVVDHQAVRPQSRQRDAQRIVGNLEELCGRDPCAHGYRALTARTQQVQNQALGRHAHHWIFHNRVFL